MKLKNKYKVYIHCKLYYIKNSKKYEVKDEFKNVFMNLSK